MYDFKHSNFHGLTQDQIKFLIISFSYSCRGVFVGRVVVCKDLLSYPLGREGVLAAGGRV